jgi:hypothetical protein
MLTASHTFSLVSFGQDTVQPGVYAQVERVYLETIGLTARTETNEIVYWRDRYNEEFQETGDRLYVYGLLRENEAIGFALVFYFAASKLVVVDHIAIKELERHFGAFFYFKQMIAQHIADQGHQVDYVLVEIVTSKEGDPHPIKPQLLIDLLKQREFKIVKMRYFTPSIKEGMFQRRIETALMLTRHDRGDRISSATLLSLLHCLLYELYLRWYTPHSKDVKGFKKQLDDLYATYKRELAKNEFIGLNGAQFPNSTMPIVVPPSRPSDAHISLARPVALLVILLPV